MPQDWEPRWHEAHGWYVSFTVEGRRVRCRLRIRERGARPLARKAARKLWEDEWASALNPAPVRTGPAFWEAAGAYMEAGGERRFLAKLLPVIGREAMASDVDEAMVDDVAAALYPDASPATVQRQVRGPMFAVRRHAEGKRRRRGADRKRLRWLTPEEAERLILTASRLTLPRHSEPELHTLRKIVAMLGTGWRTGECFAADVADWRPETREWWTPAIVAGAGKSDAAARWVVMPQRAVDLMGELPEVGRAFLTPYGKPIVMRENGGGQMATAFNRARDAAGLGPDVTPHVLRHTWATWAYAQTRDLLWLARRGGWSSTRMVERYAHLAPADLPARLRAHGWDMTDAHLGQHAGNVPADVLPFAKKSDG